MANSSDHRRKNRPAPTGTALIRDGELAWLDQGQQGVPVILVPSENVALFSVHLPMKSRRQRLQALPFAVEERIAQPLDRVHIVLADRAGEPRGGTGAIAAVVSHAKMKEWRALAEAAGITHCRMIPDCLALPVVGPDTWTVAALPDRAVIRTGDGLGFATRSANLAAFWEAAGKPALALHDGSLPDQLSRAVTVPMADQIQTDKPVLDLCQGVHAGQGGAVDRRAGILAGITGVAAGLFLALMVVDVMALRAIAADREDALRAQIASMNGNRPVPGDLARAASDLLPSSGDAGTFLPILTKVAKALPSDFGGFSMRSASFDDTTGTLTMEIEAEDLAALQRVEAALSEAGLQPDTGAATTADGAATQSVTIRMPGGSA